MIYRPALHGNWDALSLARRALKDKFPTPKIRLTAVLLNRQAFLPHPVVYGEVLRDDLNVVTWNWNTPSKSYNVFCLFIYLNKIPKFDFGLVGSLDGLGFVNTSEIKISTQKIFIANL